MFCRKDKESKVDPVVVSALRYMVNQFNPFVKTYRMAAERFNDGGAESFVKLQLFGRRPHDGRQYNIPTCDEVAALIVGTLHFSLIIL